ncbi:MAG: hypothetical protein KC421_13040, partial [Anaerolineales bacterium]|nr:hypothetical protein [Anaerolineales bacterium]
MNKRRICYLFVVLVLTGCLQATAANGDGTANISPPTPFVTATPEPEPLLPYGLVYPLAGGMWTEADREDVHTQLVMMHEMHVNTVVQTFSSGLIGTGHEADWLIFLDEAERAEIQVITRLWPVAEWDDEMLDLTPVAAFLDVVG